MISLYLFGAAFLVAAFLFQTLLRRLRLRSFKHLPGPPPGPWLVGNMPDLLRPKEIGIAEFEWTREYGTTLSIMGTFGREMLFTSDPKALQYVFNTSAYNFTKAPETCASIILIAGKGIIWANGMQHSRHRKVMNPAFSYGALREFLHIFHHTAQKTVMRLKEHVDQTGQPSAVVDISSWLARSILDALGMAAFDYPFKALDGVDTDFFKVYKNLFADAFLDRSNWVLGFEASWGLIPNWAVALVQSIPTKRLHRLRKYMKASEDVAQGILERELASHAQGKEGSKDLMSLLIKANLSENPKSKLREDEILPQLTTLFFAGHETTASTLTWALYELSRHPEFQAKVREEIKTTRANAAKRGDTELTVADLDSMKNVLAMIKETLRFHPILNVITRMAGRDDVIPLSIPQKTKTGEMVTSVPVSKGQRVHLSVSAYNRLKSVWGEDADQWRPERFTDGIESIQKTNLGVIGNLATFGSGLRGCMGWRFAMIDMQAVLTELIENFEFLPPPGNIEIIRCATAVMTPMVKNSKSRRTELPLLVKPISS